MSLDVSSTQLAIAIAAGIVGACYIAFILAPSVTSYGRFWERVAAGFLTLYILATMVGVGALLGLLVVWSYDQYA
jgi:hypothetical protein